MRMGRRVHSIGRSSDLESVRENMRIAVNRGARVFLSSGIGDKVVLRVDVRGIPGSVQERPRHSIQRGSLYHYPLRTEAGVHERPVARTVSHIASEFRKSGNLRPKIRNVRLIERIIVIDLVRSEKRRSGYRTEPADSAENVGYGMEPERLGSIRSRSSRLRERFVVHRPIVISLGGIIPVEVLRKIHGRRFSERMGDLPGIGAVAGVGNDIEAGEGSFLPIPSDEIVVQHVAHSPTGKNRESVRIERLHGFGVFPVRLVRPQALRGSSDGIEERMVRRCRAVFQPNEVRLERKSPNGFRGRAVSNVRKNVEVRFRRSYRGNRQVFRRERLES